MQDGAARHAFVPEYLIAPFLFTGDERLETPADAALDAIGGAVILGALRRLAPELCVP